MIKGESQDDQHKGEIEVVSWSWGCRRRPTLGGGTATGKADDQRAEDREAGRQRLHRADVGAATNEPIKKAVLTLRKAGKTPARILEDHDRARPRDRRSTSKAATTAGSPSVVERVSFSFNKIERRVRAAGQGRAARRAARRSADQWSDRLAPDLAQESRMSLADVAEQSLKDGDPVGGAGAAAGAGARQAGRRRSCASSCSSCCACSASGSARSIS